MSVNAVEIQTSFGPADTAPITFGENNNRIIRYLQAIPMDSTNGAPAALAADVTYTIFVNGVSVGTIVVTAAGGAAPVFTLLTPAVALKQNDCVAISPSIAAGVGRAVGLNLLGEEPN